MNQISITKRKGLSVGELKELLPYEITADGEVIAVVLSPAEYRKLTQRRWGEQPKVAPGRW